MLPPDFGANLRYRPSPRAGPKSAVVLLCYSPTNCANGSTVSSKPPRVIRDRASTLRNTPAVTPAQTEQGLIIIVNGVVSTYPLPPQGVVTLGRARESDIQIIDPSVSRVHARIRVGHSITIEDAGSANGTRLRGELLAADQPVELPPGESVELGSAIVMLQRRQLPTREWRI